jgi:hypothetical protein
MAAKNENPATGGQWAGFVASRLMTGQQGCRGMGVPPSRPMAELMRLSYRKHNHTLVYAAL